jgi:hypothetical protein
MLGTQLAWAPVFGHVATWYALAGAWPGSNRDDEYTLRGRGDHAAICSTATGAPQST